MINYETFTLSDLTKEFFSELCYIEQMWSIGCILMVTENGQEYWLGKEGYDEDNPQNTVPLLATCEKWDKEIENNGWTYVISDYDTDILIRNDFYEKMNKLYYDVEHRKLEHEACYQLLQCVLKPKYGLQRKWYTKTLEKWNEKELECRKIEENRKRIALTAKDIEWKPVHISNLLYNSIMGIYGFLFKKQENGKITGYKWTIVFQYQEDYDEYEMRKKDAPIEAYNLYFKEYRDVAGVLGYRKPGYSHQQCYTKSTIQDGVHSYGKFVRSYKTLELAKEAVLYRNEYGGNVNLENIIRVSMDEQTISKMEKHYETKIAEKGYLNIEKNITFKELRNYLSSIDRLSICMLETSCYENFLCLEHVPHTYDDYYVYGIGIIKSEFYKIGKYDYAASGELKDLVFLKCIEIMLSEEPKSVLIKRDREEPASSGLNKDPMPKENEKDE